MNYGGEAADQVVRYSLDGMDHGLRLSGTLAKNLAVFFAAVMKDQKKSYGKTRMVRMLRENRPLKFFTVPSDRLKDFAREGKKRGLLYVVIRDRKNPGQCEIMVFADDAAKVNRVMDRMHLDFVRSESGTATHEPAGMEQESRTTDVSIESTGQNLHLETGREDELFGFWDIEKETGNFTNAQEGMRESRSGLSSRSRDSLFGGVNHKERPSVRSELEKIKRGMQERSVRRSWQHERKNGSPATSKKINELRRR